MAEGGVLIPHWGAASEGSNPVPGHQPVLLIRTQVPGQYMWGPAHAVTAHQGNNQIAQQPKKRHAIRDHVMHPQ